MKGAQQTPYKCNKLLAKVEEGKGCILCPRCKRMNYYEVVQDRRKG